jgi:hypothetical protein
VWQERNKGEEPEIIWSKLSSARPYSLGGRSCPLFLAEKTDTTGEMLNRRRELMNRCLHKDPYELSNFSTILSTGHHIPVQPHDVLLDLQPDLKNIFRCLRTLSEPTKIACETRVFCSLELPFLCMFWCFSNSRDSYSGPYVCSGAATFVTL